MQRDLSAAVRVVKDGTGEIAQGTEDLSHRTERQAASLEVTAASVETLARTVGQNADSAATALRMTGAAATIAREGKDHGHVQAAGESDACSRRRCVQNFLSLTGVHNRRTAVAESNLLSCDALTIEWE